MSTTKIDLGQLGNLVGRTLTSETWHVVTQEQVNGFAEASGDRQWIHVDPERAKRESPYGTTIAHGFLSLSMATMFLFDLLEVEGARTVLNYGLNKVRFPAPVPVGSKVRMAFEVLSVEAIPGGSQVTFKGTLEVAGAAKPGMVIELVFRYLA